MQQYVYMPLALFPPLLSLSLRKEAQCCRTDPGLPSSCWWCNYRATKTTMYNLCMYIYDYYMYICICGQYQVIKECIYTLGQGWMFVRTGCLEVSTNSLEKQCGVFY